MNIEILFEIKKFPKSIYAKENNIKTVFFTDATKIDDIEKIILNLPKYSAIIVREYSLDLNKREIFAKKIINLARKKNIKVLIAKDISLALKLNADGVHFSDYDHLPVNFFNKKSFAKNFIFSLSCHTISSFIKIVKYQPDFIFISPIFKTTSHLNSKIFGINNLKKIIKIAKQYRVKSSIFALGGVAKGNLKLIRKMQLNGIGAIDFFNTNFSL